MKEVTDRITSAVSNSGLEPFLKHGFARCALETDYKTIIELNEVLPKIIPDWNIDDWAVGHDGAGNYFVVSRSGRYAGVHLWDHEVCELCEEFASVDDFIEECLAIERDNQQSVE